MRPLSKSEPNQSGLTFMRAVQWPIPGILKAPAATEALKRGVRAGTRSKRSPIPFRNWTANGDRGWARKEGAGFHELIVSQPLDTNTHLSVFAFGPLCGSSVEPIQLGQDQSHVSPQGVAVSPQFDLLSGPIILFAEGHSRPKRMKIVTKNT